MCFFPGSSILVPPNDKARLVCLLLKVGFFLHFTLGVLFFVSFQWFDGTFDIIAVFLGVTAVYSSEGYSIQTVFCYSILCAMYCLFAVLRLIMYFASNLGVSIVQREWQHTVFLICLISAPVIYLVNCLLSYHLYSLLKDIINDVVNDGFGGAPLGVPIGAQPPYGGPPPPGYGFPGGGGGGGGGYGGGGGSGGGRGYQPQTRNQPPPGFKAFSGQGHKLGGT